MAQPSKKDAYDEDLNPNLHTKSGKAVADISGSGSFTSNNPMNFFAMRAKEKVEGFKEKRKQEKELKDVEKGAFEEQYDISAREQATMRGQEKAKQKAYNKFDPEQKPIKKITRGIKRLVHGSSKVASGTEKAMMGFSKRGESMRPEAVPSEFNHPQMPMQREPKGRFIDVSPSQHEGGMSPFMEEAFFRQPARTKGSALEGSIGGNIGNEFSKGGGVFGAFAGAMMGQEKRGKKDMMDGGREKKNAMMGGGGFSSFSTKSLLRGNESRDRKSVV